MNAYLDLAKAGKNNWWRFILAIGLILFLWQIIGSLPSVLLVIWVLADGSPQTDVTSSGQFIGVDKNLSFVALMLASVLFMTGLYLAMRFIHRRPLQTLITPARSIAWGRIFQAFTIWFILCSLMSLLEVYLHPGRYVLTFNLKQFIPFFFLALLLLPIQTSAEELFFRGYILQGVGLRVRNIWILSAISGFLFMVPHFLNPEAKLNYPLMGLYYFSIGAVMAFISLRDGRLEAALGLHAANNLFSGLLVNYSVTVMPTPSLYTVNALDVTYSVIAALVGLAIFLVLFLGPLRRKDPAIPATIS
jgi:uncharacterized protein